MTDLFSHGYALLIGVNENAVPGWELPDVAKDIAALTRVLTYPERCAYAHENVRDLTGKEATKDNILAGLTWLKEKLADDKSDNETALIYYSGHGWQDNSLVQPAYYLIPYDVTQNKLRQTALRADDFAAEITSLNPHRLLVLLDCCHAGGMGVKDLDPTNLSSFNIPPAWLLGGQKGVVLEPCAKDIEDALLIQGSGRAVLNSSRNNEKSYIRKDRAMSIFTYHLIEALTGYAPHAPEDKEVTVADVLSYVWRKVPQSAQAEYQCPQQPDGQLSGNFSIALLLGGNGTPPGKSLPDPLAPLPTPKVLPNRSVFDQRGQTIHGTQTNIAGDVHGPVFSGDFKGPIMLDQRKVDANSDDYFAGNKNDNSIKVGNITGSTGITIGHGARATITQNNNVDPDAISETFATILKWVDKLDDDDQKRDAKDALKKLEEEAKKGEHANEGRMRKWLDFLAGMSGDLFDVVVATFTNPVSGLSTAFRKITERTKKEWDAKKTI